MYAYTLQDFITDVNKKGLKPLTGPFDFASIFVGSLSVQELPLDHFVKEHEIIFSTAIGCLDDDATFRQFIHDIRESRAAALIVTFKDPAYQLSRGVLDYAAEIGLPLFSLPWEVRFADVIHFVTTRIHEKNQEGYKRVQDRLFSAYFTSKSLDEAAKILFYFLGSPVAVAGKNFNIKGCYPAVQSEADYEAIEIRINAFLWGYIYIYNPEKCTALLEDRILIEKYISLPLSMWFNKENIEDMMVLKLKNDFVWNLANKNYSSFLDMAQQGMHLGFNLYNPYMCIAFRICSHDPEQLLDEYSPESAALSSAMEALILAERKKRGLNIMFADRSLMFIVYVEVPASGAEQAIEEFVNVLDTAFIRQHPALQLYWGMSAISQESTEQFDKLYQNAFLALQYCMNAHDKKHVFTYRDTQFHQIISELSYNENIKTAAKETLDALVAYDKTSSMDLVRTLIEFLKSNCNTSMTARHLHLNRQSLLYRLKKIEALTGMSLSQRKDLFLLELYTRIFSDY